MQPEELKSILFLNDQHTQFPLLIYDPLETIHALIVTLESLCSFATKESFGFRRFQLSGANILRGFSVHSGPGPDVKDNPCARRCHRHRRALGTWRSSWSVLEEELQEFALKFNHDEDHLQRYERHTSLSVSAWT